MDEFGRVGPRRNLVDFGLVGSDLNSVESAQSKFSKVSPDRNLVKFFWVALTKIWPYSLKSTPTEFGRIWSSQPCQNSTVFVQVWANRNSIELGRVGLGQNTPNFDWVCVPWIKYGLIRLNWPNPKFGRVSFDRNLVETTPAEI